MINRTQDEITKNWKKEYTKPVVSIACMTFNHERYISEALDGFLSQETEFPFEVIVHDDCSSDKTVQIIRKYEARFPRIIKPIYQKENMYSQNFDVLGDIIFPSISGDYIALCEGDDYWIDPNKLQYAYCYMQAHPNCSMVSHLTEQEISDSKKRTLFNPEFLKRGGVISSDDLIIEPNIIHTSSYFFNRKMLLDNIALIRKVKLFDAVLVLLAATEGYVFLIPKVMSVYRYFNTKSFTKKYVNDNEFRIDNLIKVNRYASMINVYRKRAFNNSFKERNRRKCFEIYRIRGDIRKIRSSKYRDLYKGMDVFSKGLLVVSIFPKPLRLFFLQVATNPVVLKMMYKVRESKGALNYKR